MSSQRPAANRMTLQQFKARRVGAKKGFELLKKKRDALKTKFQMMLKEIIDAKNKVGVLSSECAFAFAKAKYAAGDISQLIIQKVKKPSFTMKVAAENVAGVYLPVFDQQRDSTKDSPFLSLGAGQGGQVISSCRQKHMEFLDAVIKLASLQTCFLTLDAEIKMTSRRVNALDYVVIPKIEIIIAYIGQEMDELEREEFYRVKKVVEKKKQKIIKEKLLAEENNMAAATVVKIDSENFGGLHETAFDGSKNDEQDIVF
jgi:V-type H+-transporting ATPase subunit D